MNTTTRPARNAAIATMDEEQDRKVALIREQVGARASALGNIANRLGISQSKLQDTLMATVFKGANPNEFAALVVVADAYKLNPLLKEIYAFPQKGGGIVPLVSIDGWVRIMNEHPEFDGIEFKDMADDKGKLYAIEATIHRKDRTRPTQIIEYLSECQGTTGPWNKSPARMLRHRALIQCARYAFGFSGISVEGEEGGYAAQPQMRDVTPMPTREMISAGEQVEVMDAATGEFIPTGNDEIDREGRAAFVQDEPADASDPAPDDVQEVDWSPIYDALMAKINKASAVGYLTKAVNEIPADMPAGWKAGLKERAVERDAELRGAK